MSQIAIRTLVFAVTVTIGFGEVALPGSVTRGTSAAGPLRVHPDNPRYFTDGSGRAVYLAGWNVWSNLQDGFGPGWEHGWGNRFDFDAYLDDLVSNNLNYINLWLYETVKVDYPGGRYQGSPPDFPTPNPWQRTGPGKAADGGLKFDLTEYHQPYFDRLRSRVVAAGNRGVYVSVMLFEGFSSPARKESHHDYLLDPPAADGRHVIIADTDHFGWDRFRNDEGLGRAWAWKSVTRGYNASLIVVIPNKAGWSEARRALGDTRTFATRMDLAAMTPRNDLASTKYCLANPGGEYLVYLPTGGKVTVDLSEASGPLAVEWFNPRTSDTTKSGTVHGGARRDLMAPFEGDAVLYLVGSATRTSTESDRQQSANHTATVHLHGEHDQRVMLQDLKPNTIVDCSGAKFFLGLADKSRENNYILQVRGSVNTVVQNVEIIGDVPFDNSWNDQYKNNNSAAFSFISSHGGTLQDARITRAWDALRAARDTKGSYTFRRVYVTDWRDDVIETDSGYPNTLIEDCLFDGGYCGFSCREGEGSNADDASDRWFRSRQVLMRLAPFCGNERKYGTTPMHSAFVKLHKNCQSLEITDNVWAFESTVSSSWGSNWTKTFKDKLKISERNLLLWLGAGPFPSSIWVPPGFSTLSGQAARDEWNHRRDDWLGRVIGAEKTE